MWYWIPESALSTRVGLSHHRQMPGALGTPPLGSAALGVGEALASAHVNWDAVFACRLTPGTAAVAQPSSPGPHCLTSGRGVLGSLQLCCV